MNFTHLKEKLYNHMPVYAGCPRKVISALILICYLYVAGKAEGNLRGSRNYCSRIRHCNFSIGRKTVP